MAAGSAGGPTSKEPKHVARAAEPKQAVGAPPERRQDEASSARRSERDGPQRKPWWLDTDKLNQETPPKHARDKEAVRPAKRNPSPDANNTKEKEPKEAKAAAAPFWPNAPEFIPGACRPDFPELGPSFVEYGSDPTSDRGWPLEVEEVPGPATAPLAAPPGLAVGHGPCNKGFSLLLPTLIPSVSDGSVGSSQGALTVAPGTGTGLLEAAAPSASPWSQGCSSEQVVQMLRQALCEQAVRSLADRDGFVPISKILKAKPALSSAAFGNARNVAKAVDEKAYGAVRLDKARLRVRLERSVELACAEVPLKTLEGFLRLALDDESSEVAVRDAWVLRRSKGRQSSLRRAAEELFSAPNLEKDSKLRSKISLSPNGEIPLTWLIARYWSDAFGLDAAPPKGSARAAEAAADELGRALLDSEILLVDSRRMVVCLRPSAAPPARGSGRSGCCGSVSKVASGCPDEVSGRGSEAPRRAPGGARAVTALRQLLDFYFEPFTLQHNRYLLDLVSKCIGAPKQKGPWLSKELLGFSFAFDDLSGLGRITNALSKLRMSPGDLCHELANLKHVICDADGRLQLRSKLELRSFVAAPGAPQQEMAAYTVRYMASAREQRGQAPPGMVSILSYALADVISDQSPSGQQRQARVKRQLLVHHTDLICLQGVDAYGCGASLAAGLTEEGYGFACARDGKGEANSIFWDRSRWELLGQEACAGALSVVLQPFEDYAIRVRAVCFQAKVPGLSNPSLRDLFGASDPAGLGPLIACTDLSALGGAEAAGIVEELMGLPSVAEELLGQDLAAPGPPAPPGLSQGCNLAPARTAAGCNRLRHPDAVFFRDMAPVTALSGHTEGYLSTMAQEDVVQQFPAFRLPVVAAFDWRTPYTPEGSQEIPAPSRKIRL